MSGTLAAEAKRQRAGSIAFGISVAKGRRGVHGSRTKSAAFFTVIWLRSMMRFGTRRLGFLTKVASGISNGGQHYFKLDGFEMSQIVISVEGTRVDRIMCVFRDVKRKNC